MTKSTKSSGHGSKPPTNPVKPAAENLPSFDERALLALTEKIEKGLGANKDPQHDPNGRSQMQRKANDGSRLDQTKLKSKANLPEPSKGNKRDARGNRKPPSGESTSGGRSTHRQNRENKDRKEVLLQEILALGGTEEDLQLVGDANSDDEDLDADSSAPPDKSFREDLAKFVAALGIETNVEGNATESESEQEIEDERETSVLESPVESTSAVKDHFAVNVQQVNVPAKGTPEDNSLLPLSAKDAGRLVGRSSP
jgi:ribosome biogenesis protein MAK21